MTVCAGHSVGTVDVALASQWIEAEAVLADLTRRAFGILAARRPAEAVCALLAGEAVAVETALGRDLRDVATDTTLAKLVRVTVGVACAQRAALGVDADLIQRTVGVVQALGIGLRPIDTDEVGADLVWGAIGIAAAQYGAVTVDANFRIVAVPGSPARIIRAGDADVILAKHVVGTV